ncbi:hypothetical protein [Adoxophyes orana nucleopolyhedrovirus]|uniref:hypothetical protein n=1 Tax=Adoxophyes orana nucleopolyhedrovirus TaxID=542343 RepID=UPI0001829C06|nr:hypothetical protein [Adoxophyes orana nucleopolyhedrovirus]ACF05346.1 hypothetical protein [Adoxophyes orana nucleopolyhedrovirus]
MASRSPPNYVKNNDATVKTLLKTITQMSQRCKSQNATDQVLSRASSVIYQHFPHLKLRLDLQLPELITEALMMRGANIPNQITHNYNYKYDYNSNINAAAANSASNQHQNINNGGGDAFMGFDQNASSLNAPPSFPNMPSTLSLPPNEEMELQKKVNEITRPLTIDSYKSLVVVINHFVMQHIQSVNLQEAFNRLLSFEQMYEASATAASTFFGNDNINALIRCIETKTGIKFTIGPDLCQELASIIVTVRSIFNLLSINSEEKIMSIGYLTQITNVLDAWKSERLQLMKENNNAKIQIEEFTMQLSTVKSELLEKNLQITSLQENAASLQTINNQIENYIYTDLAKNTNFQFNRSNNFEQNVINAFKAANTTIASLRNDLDRQKQFIQYDTQTKLSDQSQIELLQTQVQSLNVKNATLNETNLKLIGENELVKNELVVIKQKLLQNINAVSNYTEQKKSIDALSSTIQDQNSQILNLQSTIVDQSAEIESLKQEVLNNSSIKPMKKVVPTKNIQLRSDTKTMAEVDKLKNEINEIKSLFALSKNNLVSLNNTTEQNLTDKYNQALAMNKEKDDIINNRLNQLDEDYKTKIQTNINVQSQLSDELQILQHNFNRLEEDFNDNLENFELYARRMAFLEYTESDYNVPDTTVNDIPDTSVNIKNLSPNELPTSHNQLSIKNIEAIQIPKKYKINNNQNIS